MSRGKWIRLLNWDELLARQHGSWTKRSHAFVGAAPVSPRGDSKGAFQGSVSLSVGLISETKL